MSASRRKSRRPLLHVPRRGSIAPVANAMILLVALIIILLTRCEEDASSSSEQNAQWFNNFITPRDLHLPKSVIDLEREQSKKKHAK